MVQSNNSSKIDIILVKCVYKWTKFQLHIFKTNKYFSFIIFNFLFFSKCSIFFSLHDFVQMTKKRSFKMLRLSSDRSSDKRLSSLLI